MFIYLIDLNRPIIYESLIIIEIYLEIVPYITTIVIIIKVSLQKKTEQTKDISLTIGIFNLSDIRIGKKANIANI